MITLEQQLSGHFLIESVQPDGTRKLLAEFDNLITDSGFNAFDIGGALSYCGVGSGNTTPVVGDTALNAQIASVLGVPGGVITGSSAVAPYYGWVRGTWRFQQGVAAGNISEVAVGWASSPPTLFSRALILDGDGNPTTITVLSNEIIDISYEFRSYVPTADQTGTITLAGVTYNYTARAANATTWGNYLGGFMINTQYGSCNAGDGNIGTVTQSPSNSVGSSATPSPLNYVNNSHEREWTVTFGIDSANFAGGMKSLVMERYCLGQFQFGFTPAIPKDNTKTLILNGKYSWARKTI